MAGYAIEFGIGKRQVADVFAKIIEVGGKVIDVNGPLEFVAVVPTEDAMRKVVSYINATDFTQEVELGVSIYTGLGATSRPATESELQAPDETEEHLRVYAGADLADIARPAYFGILEKMNDPSYEPTDADKRLIAAFLGMKPEKLIRKRRGPKGSRAKNQIDEIADEIDEA